MKKILVIGSLNMDSVIETCRIPQSGETIAGKQITKVPGGKGANQAFAAGKLGGCVEMIGAVGCDPEGDELKNNLRAAGVDVSSVFEISGEVTGQAFISVNEEGENSIIIISGANGKVTRELIQQCRKQIEESDIILMQLEIPIETVCYVKELAHRLGKMIILDPAPASDKIPEELWDGIDFIKPNETELEILTGWKMKSIEERKAGAREMLRKGVGGVLLTMGGSGCLLVTEGQESIFEARKVKVMDTTAAGDVFIAAFAEAIAEGKEPGEAIRFAQDVSAVAVQRKGAQTSIPSREEVEKWINKTKEEEERKEKHDA